MPHPDEAAGYQAAIEYRWATGRKRRASIAAIGRDQRDEGAPADASPESLRGWRAGVNVTAAW